MSRVKLLSFESGEKAMIAQRPARRHYRQAKPWHLPDERTPDPIGRLLSTIARRRAAITSGPSSRSPSAVSCLCNGILWCDCSIDIRIRGLNYAARLDREDISPLKVTASELVSKPTLRI